MPTKRPVVIHLAALLAGAALLWGCSKSTEEPDEAAMTAETEEAPTGGEAARAAGELPFAGTTWQLVAINSMDDTVTEPADKSKYTVTFLPEGEVAVVADCNRGRATWTSEGPSQVQLGPMALTRAMCPPGSISDKFAKELGFVRSYVMEDGDLHLATMADGSIIHFEPAP